MKSALGASTGKMSENDEILTLADIIGHDPWPDVDKRIDIEIALNKILPRYRDALILWGQGFPYSEIAEELNVSQGTAYNYVQAGRRSLEDLLA